MAVSITKKDGTQELDFRTMNALIPPVPMGDAQINYTDTDEKYRSIELNPYYTANVGDVPCGYSLYGMNSDAGGAEVYISEDPMHPERRVGEFPFDSIGRENDYGGKYLTYSKYKFVLDDVPSASAVKEVRSRANSALDRAYGLINEISALRSNYWPKGGGANDCYGASIGNSYKEQVIDLNNAKFNTGLDFAGNLYDGMKASMWSGYFTDDNYKESIGGADRRLVNSAGKTTVNWEDCQLNSSDGTFNINWKNGKIYSNRIEAMSFDGNGVKIFPGAAGGGILNCTPTGSVLNGSWFAENLTVAGKLTAANMTVKKCEEAQIDYVNADTVNASSGIIIENGCLKIGETIITEDQLKKLLELIK